MTDSIAFFLTTIQRPTLWNTLDSLMRVVQPQDHIYIAVDDGLDMVAESAFWQRFNSIYPGLSPAPFTIWHEPQPLGFWGHGLRNKYQGKLKGDWIHNMDDDDVYEPNFNAIRPVLAANPGKLVLARFWGKGRMQVWNHPGKVEYANVGTPCGLIPNQPDKLPEWKYVYGGDFLFYQALAANFEVVWHDQFIVRCEPHHYGWR